MLQRIGIMALVLVLLAACAGNTPTGTGATPTAASGSAGTDATAGAGATAAPVGEAKPVALAMSYIPNVQFAHFYVADKKGYYAQEGLKVSFDYNFETDIIQRVAQGTVQFGMGGASSILLARSQGLPVVTVATNSQKFPTVFYSKAGQNIQKPADLKGKTVGIPGRFGDAYIGLQALLYATKLKESDLNVQEVGFTQVAALTQDKIQVASGYGNNEPIQLEQQGIKVNVIRVSDAYPLASDGIITSEQLAKIQPELVRSFIRATFRGMQDVIGDPDTAFTTSLEYIPELKKAGEATQQLQRKVLQATLDYWQSDLTSAQGLGYTNMASWQATHTFLRDSGLLKSDVDLSKAFSNDYLK